MRRQVFLLALLFLSGCSLSPLINGNVTDYFQVADLAANRIILLNILRAKDGAPLHFSELSIVRGQMTASGTAGTTFPYAQLLHDSNSVRAGASFGATVSSSPSFDVSSLDTQDFTKGVMTPISSADVKFFLDEGIDYRLVWLLLVSGVRTAGNQEIILNEPESTRQLCYTGVQQKLALNASLPAHYTIINAGETCDGQTDLEFYGFLRELNNTIRRFYPVTIVGAAKPVGSPFTLDMRREMRTLATMDPAKYRLKKLASGQYQLETAARRETNILCEEPQRSSTPKRGSTPTVLTVLQPEEDSDSTVGANACIVQGQAQAGGSMTAPASKITIGTAPNTVVVTLRSTLEVIQYLGQILSFQEQQSALEHTNRCVTLGFDPEHRFPLCSDRDVVFHLQHAEGASAIGVDYDGQYWAVPQSAPCDTVSSSCDHTLETMGMISLLLNQNKSAKDIPSTPVFEAVP